MFSLVKYGSTLTFTKKKNCMKQCFLRMFKFYSIQYEFSFTLNRSNEDEVNFVNCRYWFCAGLIEANFLILYLQN